MKNTTDKYIQVEQTWSAHNYHPLEVVIERAEGVWVWDVENNKYIDMLAGYSALNQGHLHPKIVDAARRQLDLLTLTSRAFYNDKMGKFCQTLAKLCNKQAVLPMNTGAEAVETAIKAARRWAYFKKRVPEDRAEVIVCENNFHGRTTTVISFSTNSDYRRGFGPFTPGFVCVPYGNIAALESAITMNTAAFLVEPIQGEAGVIIPPEGYLAQAKELCTRNNILLLADEIQTGLGRTGAMFCCDHEKVVPDVYILGKALGGGIVPISAVVADWEVLDVFDPGSHGSTFGGNPLACAIAMASVDVILQEKLAEKACVMGQRFRQALRPLMGNGIVQEVRGKGLLNAIELTSKAGPARQYVQKLKERGILAKETHDTVIRFAPPLIIQQNELDWAIDRIISVFSRAK